MSVVLSILGVVGGVLLFLLKCIGILLLVVLVLAVLLMLCPFCADVLWENETLTVKAGALGLLDRFLYLDFEQLRLVPDLGPDQPTVKDRVSFRVTAQAYAIVFTALRVLYEFWHEKVLDLFL